MKTKLKQNIVSNAERKFIEAEEDALADFQYLLFDSMKESGVGKAELAARVGVSRARISQLFSSSANPTLKTVVRCLAAVDKKVDIKSCVVVEERPAIKSRVARADSAASAFLERCLLSSDNSWVMEEEFNNENYAPKCQVA